MVSIPGPVNGGALVAPPGLQELLLACERGHRALLVQMIVGRHQHPDAQMVLDLEPWRN